MTIDTYAANEAVRAFAQASYGIIAPTADGTATENAYTAANHAHAMFEKYQRH